MSRGQAGWPGVRWVGKAVRITLLPNRRHGGGGVTYFHDGGYKIWVKYAVSCTCGCLGPCSGVASSGYNGNQERRCPPANNVLRSPIYLFRQSFYLLKGATTWDQSLH